MPDNYTLSNVSELDTPALVVYEDRVVKNIRTAGSMIGDLDRLRPHVKTNKCAEVVRLMQQAGISKFKCATIAEAEMLALANARDVLLAYQPVGPKAKRFLELQTQFPGTLFSCLVDNEASLRDLSEAARATGAIARVFIDLNVGMNRSGVIPGEKAMAVFREAQQAESISFIGLHAYDGHLRDSDLHERTRKCDDAFQAVESMRRAIAETTGIKPVIVAGGTPTFPIHAKRNDVEASPGTFVFWDKGYQQILTEQPFEFAALVVTRVISVPSETILCLDLGHKSIASENPLQNRVYLLDAPELKPIGHSEEHMVWESQTPHGYRPGHVFYGVPHHICPTVAQYDEAAICKGRTLVDTWQILSRKRRLTI